MTACLESPIAASLSARTIRVRPKGLASRQLRSTPSRFVDTGRMIVAGQASAVIERSAQDMLEFALDLDRYRQIDTKFRKIHRHQHELRCVRTLPGLRALPRATQNVARSSRDGLVASPSSRHRGGADAAAAYSPHGAG